jgi:hypothetical protein
MNRVFGAAARLVSRGESQWYRAPLLGLHPEVVHGLTHASLGNFSLTTDPAPQSVVERRERLLAAAGLSGALLVAPALHHSSGVAVVREGLLPEGKCDALVTQDTGVVLAVTVADCVPVFFVDVVSSAFGVAHAGWRGLALGIVRRAIRTMRREFRGEPANLLVGTGPAIRGPSYEVGPEVAGLFPEEVSVPTGDPAEGRVLLDLPSIALGQAAAEGVPPDNLVDFSLCTMSHPDDLFSHRRGDRGRHWAFIGRAAAPPQEGC